MTKEALATNAERLVTSHGIGITISIIAPGSPKAQIGERGTLGGWLQKSTQAMCGG